MVIGCFDFGDEKKGEVFNEVLERLVDFLSEKMFPETLSKNFPYYSKVKVLDVGVACYFPDPFSSDLPRVISPDPP